MKRYWKEIVVFGVIVTVILVAGISMSSKPKKLSIGIAGYDPPLALDYNYHCRLARFCSYLSGLVKRYARDQKPTPREELTTALNFCPAATVKFWYDGKKGNTFKTWLDEQYQAIDEHIQQKGPYTKEQLGNLQFIFFLYCQQQFEDASGYSINSLKYRYDQYAGKR